MSAVIQIALAVGIAALATERKPLARLVALVLSLNVIEALIFAGLGPGEDPPFVFPAAIDIVIVWSLPFILLAIAGPLSRSAWTLWIVIITVGVALSPLNGSTGGSVFIFYQTLAAAAFGLVLFARFVPSWAREYRSPEREQALLMALALAIGVGVRAARIGSNDPSTQLDASIPYVTAAILFVAAAFRVLASNAPTRIVLFSALLGSVVVGLVARFWDGTLLYEFIPQSVRPTLIAAAILVYDLFAITDRPRRFLARASIVLVAWSAFVLLALLGGGTGLYEPPNATGLLIAGSALVLALPLAAPLAHRLIHPETTGDARSAAPGDVLKGRYRVLHRLSEGGQGRTMVAADLKAGRSVLLKEVVCHYRPGARAQRWALDREASLAQVATGEGLPEIVETFAWRGNYYLAREYIEGPTLAERASEGIDRGHAVQIVRDILTTLARLHAHGIVHADLKPQNVILRGDRSILIDLGIAHDRSSPMAMTEESPHFTPSWAAPEQRRGDVLDVRSDIYQAGLLLAWLVGPGEDTPLGEIIAKATAREPAERFASAAEFRAALDPVLTVGAVHTPAAPHFGMTE